MSKKTQTTKGQAQGQNVRDRLEYLRNELRCERISWGEIAELQSLAQFIEKDDVELLEAAGVPTRKHMEVIANYREENKRLNDVKNELLSALKNIEAWAESRDGSPESDEKALSEISEIAAQVQLAAIAKAPRGHSETVAELFRVKKQRDELVAAHSEDCRILRGQVKYAEAQRDELLAALKLCDEYWSKSTPVYSHSFVAQEAQAAIAKAEGSAQS